ncbi:unnamed protein product [Nippostrongylus brasiliensis]|uniref:Ribokinase (inferred by orthology to a human protein) n=1 Tax=Nippostrongylus brasiliensis TaxID=27835 RepID=A0A158R2H9_NIPBR|nr:unnamed protein product [Nippostrongylus brasiliensis]
MTTTTTTTTTAITPQNRRIFTANTGTLIANDIKPTKRVKRSLEPIIVTVVSDEPYDPTKNEQNFKTAESLLTDLAKSQGVVYNEEDVKAKMKKQGGETVFGSGFLSSGGGKGANQAVAAARLGAHVTLLAKVGDDALGEESIERLRNYGVNVDKIEKSSTASTGVASITVDAQVCTICNPAPTYRCEDRSFLQLVDILCLNRMEVRNGYSLIFHENLLQWSPVAAQNVSGLHVKDIEEAKEAVKVIQAMGPQRVVVTMGADGCVYSNGNEEPCHVAIPQVEVVDTTGAGDCFCGSLAFFVAQNRRKCRLPDWSQLGDAIKKAALISSLAVTRRGAQSSFLSREEVLKGYPDIFD